MYDAQQGATSGAHIDLSTTSGTNDYHGTLYLHRATNWLNAAPFFFNQDHAVPTNDKNPQLHRYTLGGAVGGPIIKDKLFGYLAYQHLHVSDAEIGDSFLDVPVGLTDDRSPQALAAITNANTAFGPAQCLALSIRSRWPCSIRLRLRVNRASGSSPMRIPGITLDPTHVFNAFVPGTAYFIGDQAVANLDYNATSKDTLAAKYYYQHDPTVAPYAYSNVPGFTQKLDAGTQVFSINNTYLVGSNLSTQQTLGFIREKLYNTNDQAFGPSNIPGGSYPSASIDTFGSSYFPGVSIIHVLGDNKVAGIGDSLNIGPGAGDQGTFTGVFQNRLQPSGNAIWVKGKTQHWFRRQLQLYPAQHPGSPYWYRQRRGQRGPWPVHAGTASPLTTTTTSPHSCRAMPTAITGPTSLGSTCRTNSRSSRTSRLPPGCATTGTAD